jgi:3-hydroxybutyryl-CoA dehydrogenase
LTNTSAQSVTDLAAALPNPARVAGLHFFNPAPVMRTVEIVHALQTDPELVQALVGWSTPSRQEPRSWSRTDPASWSTPCCCPTSTTVIQELDDGLATAEDMTSHSSWGLGYRTGPLAMLDMIGLDVHLHATESVYAATRDNRYAHRRCCARWSRPAAGHQVRTRLPHRPRRSVIMEY